MKPAFALNLSPDGISLLHRTSRGWLLVGAVALNDPDMPAALGYLRKTALGLAPRGFATKLILPASQILYTSVEAPGPDAANRRRQIARALEGRTPYAAEDLVFDWSGTGGRVNVAVVARETLEEAEAFAQEHRFNPVSFVAMPEDGVFAGEPFFGQTTKARSYIPEGERLVRDQDPVRIAGEADLSRLAVASAAEAPAADMEGGAGMDVPPDSPAEVTAAVAELAEDQGDNATRPTEGEADAAGEAGVEDTPHAEPLREPAAEPVAAETAPEPSAGPAAPLAAETPPPAPEAQDATVADGAAAEPETEAEPDLRAERRRARAERREREAAARAEAEVAAALARQASFGFAVPAAAAQAGDGSNGVLAEELPLPPAEFSAEPPLDTPAPAAGADVGAAPPPEPAKALMEAPQQPADAGTAFAHGVIAPEVADAAETGNEAQEAPFLAVEDEPGDAPEAALPLPALDADGVPTPFAAAATLSPGHAATRPRLGAALPDPGRSSPSAADPRQATSVTSPRLGIAAEPRPQPRAEAAGKARAARASGLGKAVIAAGKMAKAAKAASSVARRVEPGRGGPAQPRPRRAGSEAETLTVFGARRAAPVRGKPRHLGLILTLVLVFLMFAVALWSSLLGRSATPEAVIAETPTAEAPIAGQVSDATPMQTTAVEPLAEDPPFEDVPTIDAAEAEAMTAAEIDADGGVEAMETPESTVLPAEGDPAETLLDLPVDLPEDLGDELPGAADALAEAIAPGAGSAAAPDAAAAAAIAAAGAGLATELASGLAAADIATAAPAVPAQAAGGPLPDAAEGLPPRPVDPAVTERAADPLPETAALTADALPAPPQPPLPYGTDFQFGADGMIVATPDGALTPEGVTVVAGAPARVPPTRPEDAGTAPAETAASEPATVAPEALPVADPALAGKKPRPRPASLQVPAEAAPEAAPEASVPADDGAALAAPLATDPALAGFKPRGASPTVVAAAAAARSAEQARAAELAALQAELASATASAVTSSRKPASRPQDFSRGIEAALAMAATVPAPAPAPGPAPAAEAVAPVQPAAAPVRTAAAPPPEPDELDEPEPTAAAPNIPTTASVAKQATISGAISLREINLIGVYGASSNRRALVRLANGKFLRVSIGDRIDGGRVTAIGEGQLTYVKDGRTMVLRMIQQS